MPTTEVATMPFKIWITLPSGEKIAHTAKDFELEKECIWRDCGKDYRTKYREQEYCSSDCARAAANYRYKTRTE